MTLILRDTIRGAFDLDGCVVALLPAMMRRVYELQTRHVSPPETYDWYKEYGYTRRAFWEEIVDPCIQDFENLYPVSKAIDFLWKYDKKFGNPIFVTSRPSYLEDATRSWLRERYAGKYHLFMGAGTKVDVCLREEVSFLVEDHLETANAVGESGIRVYLYDREYNQDGVLHSNVERVSSWKEIWGRIGRKEEKCDG